MENLFKSDLEFIEDEVGEAFASVKLNPIFRWAKFILTDDKPNLNLQRIPKEEFPNLVESGIHAPIKMAVGQINTGHEESVPIGTITNLVEQDNKIYGLAALWEREREEDVNLLKQMKESGKYPQLSWEIYYTDEREEEGGIKAILNTILRAATLVGLPAYGGRTPILSIASQNLEEKLEKEELEKKVTELEAEIARLTEEANSKDTTIASLQTEKEELANFKNEIETAKAADEKFASVKTMFKDAGIEKDEAYFTEKKDSLLGMNEAQLKFLIDELKVFAESSASVEPRNPEGLPNLKDKKEKTDPKLLGRILRESKVGA